MNLSPRQFLSPELLTHIEQALRATGVSPGLLEFEITESLAVQDVAHAARLLQTLRGMGLKVALDDFGIGHSSLAYMLQFPIDVIKIDRVFVTHITRGRTDRAIVRAVVALSQSLGAETIAEGVEDAAPVRFPRGDRRRAGAGLPDRVPDARGGPGAAGAAVAAHRLTGRRRRERRQPISPVCTSKQPRRRSAK